MKNEKTLKAPYAFIIIDSENNFYSVPSKTDAKNKIVELQNEGKKVAKLYKGYELKFAVQTKTYTSLRIG